MAVTLNPDKEVVRAVREGLKKTGGYCPCRLERTEDNRCMCREFRTINHARKDDSNWQN